MRAPRRATGFNTKPGATIPQEIIEQAEKRGVDLTEQKPCAAFKFRDDIDMHDYIICLDRRIRDKVLIQAEEIARTDNEDYTVWESKIRLIKDLGGDASLTKSSWELDISKVSAQARGVYPRAASWADGTHLTSSTARLRLSARSSTPLITRPS